MKASNAVSTRRSASGRMAPSCPKPERCTFPSHSGYGEDLFFDPSDAANAGGPTPLSSTLLGWGLPTCGAQWFPELSRSYALDGARRSRVPHHHTGRSQSSPRSTRSRRGRPSMVGQAIARRARRCGGKPQWGARTWGAPVASPVTFYGSSFVCEPCRARPRAGPHEPTRRPRRRAGPQRAQRDWLSLFPLLATRRRRDLRCLCRSQRAALAARAVAARRRERGGRSGQRDCWPPSSRRGPWAAGAASEPRRDHEPRRHDSAAAAGAGAPSTARSS